MTKIVVVWNFSDWNLFGMPARSPTLPGLEFGVYSTLLLYRERLHQSTSRGYHL
jgi:hypothetical protein